MEKNSILIKCTLIFLFIISPVYVFSIDRRLKLYEIDNTTKYEELNNYVLSSGIERDRDYYINGDGRIDTLAYYSTGMDNDWDNSVTIIYAPKTHIISSYEYEWKFSTLLNDEFAPQMNEMEIRGHELYSKKCELYWMNVFYVLQKKYGKPTSVMVNERVGYTTDYRYFTDQEQIDTISFPHLMGDLSHFEVYWDNGERKVTLLFFNGGSESAKFSYTYLNYNNFKLQRAEIDEIEKKEAIKSNVIKALCVISLFLIVGIIGYYWNKKNKRDEIERQQKIQKQAELYAIQKQKMIEKQKEEQRRYELLAQEHNTYLKGLSDKFGICDKSIRLCPEKVNIYKEILIYSVSKHVVIEKREYAFSDILDCVVNDDIKEKDTIETYRSPSVATTRTNSGNMLKRAAIGGLLLGDTGAIIGGSTASKNTTIEYGKDTTIHNREITHNYTIVVTVRDIKTPNLLIKVGNDTNLKDEIVSLFRVIISMK